MGSDTGPHEKPHGGQGRRGALEGPHGTLGILKVVGHRQAATAIRTTFPGGPKSQKTIDGRQKPLCGENKID